MQYIAWACFRNVIVKFEKKSKSTVTIVSVVLPSEARQNITNMTGLVQYVKQSS